MKAIGVIPARYASTRFPGKLLALVAGKPLLQWVFEATRGSQRLEEVFVATDDGRIADLCEKIGASYVMTDSDLPSGSDRVWAAVEGGDADVVLNIQGDEPLLRPEMLDLLVGAFAEDIEMATLGRPLKPGDLGSQNAVKIVCNYKSEAVYFSRFPIPYSMNPGGRGQGGGTEVTDLAGACLKHIGIYAYRRDFLGRFCAQPPVDMEREEGLEQLRALYLGARIRVIPVDVESWGVDTPEDIKKIEAGLQNK